MFEMPAGLLLLVASVIASREPAADPATHLRERALADSHAWEILESLVTEVGARPVGSPGMSRAKDWAVAKLTALGFANVHVEPFIKQNAWMRGAESASVQSPVSRKLAITALGN